jgi:amino acid transporter
MGGFSTFAISFSLISITTGIFANFGFGLDQAGPKFIWTWVIVGVGQMLVALTFAHLAPRIPLAGYAYQWAAKLRNPNYGWFPGWFALVGWLTGTAGVAYAFANYFAPYYNIGTSKGIILTTTIVVILVWAVINCIGIKISSYINNASVVAELIGITLIGVGLLIWALATGHAQPTSIIFHSGGTASASLSAFAISALMGAYTLTGYEGAADLAEEALNPKRSVPRAIIVAELISSVVGFFVILGFILAIPNLKAAQASSVPLLYIMQAHLSPIMVKVAMVMVFLAIFACGLINLAAVTRLGFSMARDDMLPSSKTLRSVNAKTSSPWSIIIISSVISVLFTLWAKAELLITSVSSVAVFLAYGMVIWAGLTSKIQTSPKGAFSLGKYYRPISYAALVWIVAIIAALTLPKINHNAGYGSLVVIFLGVVWYYAHVKNLSKDKR